MAHDADVEAMAKLVSVTNTSKIRDILVQMAPDTEAMEKLLLGAHASKIGPGIFWYRWHLMQKPWKSWHRLPMLPRLGLGYSGTNGT
jgi:hypothetical protein